MVYTHRAEALESAEWISVSSTRKITLLKQICFPQTESKSVEARRVSSRKQAARDERGMRYPNLPVAL